MLTVQPLLSIPFLQHKLLPPSSLWHDFRCKRYTILFILFYVVQMLSNLKTLFYMFFYRKLLKFLKNCRKKCRVFLLPQNKTILSQIVMDFTYSYGLTFQLHKRNTRSVWSIHYHPVTKTNACFKNGRICNIVVVKITDSRGTNFTKIEKIAVIFS